jgi:hypothetical protein
MKAGNGGESSQVTHRENQWSLHEAVNHQFMLVRINRWNPSVMYFIVQGGRGDDPIEVL